MNKTPLCQALGWRYMRDMYATAYFQVDEKLHQIVDFDEMTSKIIVNSIPLHDENPKWARESVPHTLLQDFSSFRYPKLGYRQAMMEKLGMVVWQVEATRSTKRGLQDHLLTYRALPAYNSVAYAGRMESEDLASARRAQMLFKPSFTKFSVGLAKVMAGEWLGFAVSEDLAIGVSTNRAADAFLDVYYRGRQVGTVDKAGVVTIQNKILQRLAAKQSLFS